MCKTLYIVQDTKYVKSFQCLSIDLTVHYLILAINGLRQHTSLGPVHLVCVPCMSWNSQIWTATHGGHQVYSSKTYHVCQNVYVYILIFVIGLNPLTYFRCKKVVFRLIPNYLFSHLLWITCSIINSWSPDFYWINMELIWTLILCICFLTVCKYFILLLEC